jgi:hypothetical protein
MAMKDEGCMGPHPSLPVLRQTTNMGGKATDVNATPVEDLVSLDSIRPASNDTASPINMQQQEEPVAGD